MWNRYTYAAGNPLKFVDPTGQYIQVPVACSDDECLELELLRTTLQAVGASDLAEALQVGYDGRIMEVDRKLEYSKNNTVKTLARAINASRRGFRLELTTDEALRRFGGAKTSWDKRIGSFRISINPDLAVKYAFPMRNTSTGSRFFAALTPDEVLLHEVGHFFASSGLLYPAAPVNSRTSDDRALEYENLHRELKGGPRSVFERTSHEPAIPIPNL
jgi:hypothetical protein